MSSRKTTANWGRGGCLLDCLWPSALTEFPVSHGPPCSLSLTGALRIPFSGPFQQLGLPSVQHHANPSPLGSRRERRPFWGQPCLFFPSRAVTASLASLFSHVGSGECFYLPLSLGPTSQPCPQVEPTSMGACLAQGYTAREHPG